MNKSAAVKETKTIARYGYFTVGNMEATMRCPHCHQDVQGYLPKYATTYANGITYQDAMTNHLTEEH